MKTSAVGVLLTVTMGLTGCGGDATPTPTPAAPVTATGMVGAVLDVNYISPSTTITSPQLLPRLAPLRAP